MFRLVDGIVARAAAVDAGRDLRHRDVLLKEGVASLGRTGGGGEAWCGAGGGGGVLSARDRRSAFQAAR